MKSKKPVGEHPPPNNNLNSSHENFLKLKGHLESGIKLLSSITSKIHNQHPLLVAERERAYRFKNWKNQTCPFMTYSVKHFHLTIINRIDRLIKLKERIDKWSGECAESIRSIYPDGDYHDRFMKLKVDPGLIADIPNKSKRNKELLAGIQIKLKTQLENMLYFLVRRVAFREEFGRYPSIMELELIIDDYTRRFLKVLIDERFFDWVNIYPDYYDPLFKISDNRIVGKIRESQKSDTNLIIELVKSRIISPTRKKFHESMSRVVIDGSEYSKDICDELMHVKDDFERNLIESIGKDFPNKFKTRWDKEIIGVEGTFDLMTAINRLPVYLRDSKTAYKPTKKKPESKSKGNKTIRDRNIKINEHYKKFYDKYCESGMTNRVADWMARKDLVKKYGLKYRTFERILDNPP